MELTAAHFDIFIDLGTCLCAIRRLIPANVELAAFGTLIKMSPLKSLPTIILVN